MTDDTATLVGKVFGEWAPELYRAMLAHGHAPLAVLHMRLFQHIPSRGLFLFFGCGEGKTCGIATIDPRAVRAAPDPTLASSQAIVDWAQTQSWVEIATWQVAVGTPQRYEH